MITLKIWQSMFETIQHLFQDAAELPTDGPVSKRCKNNRKIANGKNDCSYLSCKILTVGQTIFDSKNNFENSLMKMFLISAILLEPLT